MARVFELHERGDGGRVLSGQVSFDLSTEELAEWSGKLVYAGIDGNLLLSLEAYDFAQEYLEAEIALNGACSSCGGPAFTFMSTHCWECEAEERERQRENEEEDGPKET